MKNHTEHVRHVPFLHISFFTLISLFTISLALPSTALAVKVNSSPSSATLSEGSGSQIFSITLDEPIISIEETAYVRLNITGDDARLVFSTSSIYYAASDWFNTRTFTVSVSNDSIQNSDNSAVITINTVSNSEYYSGYSRTIAITILDDDSSQSSQGSGGPSGGGSIIYGCRDTLAKNYDQFTEHRQILCLYASSTHSEIKKISRDLFRGMQNADVFILQKFLIAENKGRYAKALSTAVTSLTDRSIGYFGSFTQQALLEWQLSMSISPTGIFDQRTRDTISTRI